MASRIYIHAAGGLAGAGRPIPGLAAPALCADAQPLNLRTLGRSLGVTLPRLASRFGELAVIGARLCVDQLQAALPPASPLYLGTGLGDVARTDALYYQVMPPQGEMASPAQFATSGNNMAAFFVAQQLQLASRNLSVSQGDLSFEHVLRLAADDIRAGAAEQVLVGAVDETTLPRDYFVRRYPLAEHRAIGEGSAWLVLSARAAGAVGELIGVEILPPAGGADADDGDGAGDAWAASVAATMHSMLGAGQAATLLPGVRLSAAQVAALSARFPKPTIEDYRAWSGCFPTAAGLAVVAAFNNPPSHAHSHDYVHVGCDARGRSAVLFWRTLPKQSI